MFRRSPKPVTPLTCRQKELAHRESDLRERVEQLERSIAAAPRLAEETARRQQEELRMRANTGGRRLDVSMALQDKRYGYGGGSTRPRRPLRKERREGRIVFLVLVMALAVVVVWLISHLRF